MRLHGITAYTHPLLPGGSLRSARGRGGLPQFPHRPSNRSAPSTPGGSSRLRFQALHRFPGLRPDFPGSAPPCPLAGLASRGGRIHFNVTDRPVAPPTGLLTLGFDAGRFPPTPPACYPAPWRLPGPDFHRLADASLRSDQVTRWHHLRIPGHTKWRLGRGSRQRGRSQRCLNHRRPGGHYARRPRHPLHLCLLHSR